MTQTFARLLLTPRIRRLPARRMLVTSAPDDSLESGLAALGRLYGAACRLELGLNVHGHPFEFHPAVRRGTLWAFEVPPEVEDVAGVELETWPASEVVELVHRADDDETEAIARLRAFAALQGFAAGGPVEAEYLTPPGSSNGVTRLRLRVDPAQEVER